MTEHALLQVVNGEVKTGLKCSACELSGNDKLTTCCMDGTGPTNVDFMFVGHGPGEDDDRQGLPYTGATGDLLRDLLRTAGIPEQEVFITNATKCCAFETSLTDKHFKACKGYLLREINRVRPKAIVSIGAQACNWLTGLSGVSNLRKHGLPCLLSDDLLVFPIQQPAVLFHQTGKRRETTRLEFVEDLIWLKNKAKQGKLKESDTVPIDYKMANTVQDVRSFVEELLPAHELSADFETTALFPDPGEVPVAIGFSPAPGVARAIPLYCWGTNTYHFWTDEQMENEIIPLIRKLLEKVLYGHNWIQFDQKWLRFFNMQRTNVSFDTMLAHYLLDETKGTHDLEQLGLKYTTMAPWKKSFTLKDIKKLCTYLCKDVDSCCRIKQQIQPQLTSRQQWLMDNLMIPAAHELRLMEEHGMPVNKEALDKLSNELTGKLDREKNAIRAMPEVKAFELQENTTLNPESPKHLAIVMEQFLKLPKYKSTGSGKGYSTDAEVLHAYRNEPFVRHVQNIRRLDKLKGTYCDGLKNCIRPDGRIHTSYLLHGTETGRPSSQQPNLMNIPREDTSAKSLEDPKLMKSIFGSLPGYCLLQMDLSQAELRVTAAYSKDVALTQIYIDKLDAHTATAARVYHISLEEVTKAQRTLAKAVNFGVIYGKTEQGLIELFIREGASRQDAIDFHSQHRQTFTGVWRFMDGQETTIREQGYLETYFGRRRRFEGDITNHNIREGMNFFPQSTASDFCIVILTRSAKSLRAMKIDAFPVLTVYDSIVYMVKIEDLWDTVDVVQSVVDNLGFRDLLGDIKMEADFECGTDWGHLKEIDTRNHCFIQE